MDNESLPNSRRDFLKQALSLGTCGLTPVWAVAKDGHGGLVTETILGGGRYQEVANGPHKFQLSQINLHADGSNRVRTLSSPMFPHGFAADPRRGTRLLAFEKIGPGAAEFDLGAWQVVRTFAPAAGRLFYGHGVFSKDGRFLYTTETSLADGQGYIGIRDAQTLEFQGDFPSFGAHPHDCQLVEHGSTLAVTNGGGDLASGQHGNLSYIDIKSRRLVRQYAISDDRFNAGHVQIDARGDALVVSAPRRGLRDTEMGAVHFLRAARNAKLARLAPPGNLDGRLTGEALSELILPEKDLLVVTHPTPNLITCWRMSSLQLIKTIELERPRGLALVRGGQEFMVSFGNNGLVKRFSTRNLEETANSSIENTGISGSHLINLHLG